MKRGMTRPTRQPANMGQFSYVVVTVMVPYICFAVTSQDIIAHAVPRGGAYVMKRGETRDDVTPKVIGRTAEPRTTPRNSRIQPIEMPDD